MSFGSIGLGVGLTLLVAGFLGYFNFVGSSADNSISALLLIYGFPISLIGAARRRAGGGPTRPCCLDTPPDTPPAPPGFALKYAELQPLVCERRAPERRLLVEPAGR